MHIIQEGASEHMDCETIVHKAMFDAENVKDPWLLDSQMLCDRTK